MTEIRLGGPDPFPDENSGGCPGVHGMYRCTRDAGHPLPHVAFAAFGGVEFVAATWPPFQEAADDDLPAEARPRGEHKPLEEVAADVGELIRRAQLRNSEAVKEIVAPYFKRYDWCCSFALAAGLLERTKRVCPPVPPGTRLGVQAAPGVKQEEIAWARMLVAHLHGDVGACARLFGEAIDGGYVGQLLAFGVTTAADLDRRVKAVSN